MASKAGKQLEADKAAFQQARHGSEKEWTEVDPSMNDDSESLSPNAVKENEEKALTIVGLRLEDALMIYSDDGVREVVKDGLSVENLEEDYNSLRANVETFSGEVIRIVYWG